MEGAGGVSRVVFRNAVEEDLPALVAMLADDILGQAREDAGLPLDPRYLDGFRAMAADANQRLLVAEEDGEVIGSLQLSFVPGLSHRGAWRGQIQAVRITASRRGQGLGGRMIAHAVELCRRRGCRMVQLTTSNERTDAHRFYERLGFAATHQGYKLAL